MRSRQICEATGRRTNPEQLDRYTLLHLVGDVVGLLDALGAQTAVIVGHDWGAPVAWYAALFAARSLSRRDRFERAVHIPRQPVRPTSIMPRAEDTQFFSALLPIPRHRRVGVRARCPSDHSQLPLLGFRGRPGRQCKGRRNRYGAAPRWLTTRA